MIEFAILRELGYILFAAAVAVLLLRVVRVPTIVAYMAAGLILGPATGLLTHPDAVELISHSGIALLLFLVGLELSLDHMKGVGKVAVWGGLIQIVFSALAGFALGAAFGLPLGESIILGLAVTFSSTVVVVKLLSQKRTLHSLHGRIAVGMLLVQDAAVIVTLTLMAGLGPAEGDADVASMAIGIATAFGGMLALAGAAAVAARYVLPRLFRSVEGSPETVFIWSLSWCFLFILAAEAAHLSIELGAFIAGVGLAQLDFAERLRRRVQPIVNIFLAVFFVTLGVQMEPGAALSQWPLAVALGLAVLVIKPLILMLTLPRFGYGPRTTFLTALTLAQMSEFSFILAALAAGAGILGEETLSVITLTGFVTIGISSYIVLGAERLYERAAGTPLARLLGSGEEDEEEHDEQSGHIVVVGMNTLGVRLVREFAARGEDVLAIDTDPLKLNDLPARTILGTVDDAAVLEQANYQHARLVVSALQIEDTNNLLAYRCHAAGVPASIHAFDTSLIAELREIGVAHLMVSKHDGTRRIAERLREAGVMD